MALDKEDIDRLKEIFVTRMECDDTTSDLKNKLSNDSTRLAVIEQQLRMIMWILTAVGGGIITMNLKLFLGG